MQSYIFFSIKPNFRESKKRKKVRHASNQLANDTPSCEMWALRDSNPRPSACKADALNQLS